MSAAPRISVIMPAYNVAPYIAESIASVLDQTEQDWELIVVDDGSSDNTAEVVRACAARDSRVQLIQQKNGGPGPARNAGIRVARSDLIAFLDADDLWMQNKLELQVEALRRTGADLVYTNGFFFQDSNVHDEGAPFTTIPGTISGAEMYDFLCLSNRVPILSVLMRRALLDRNHLFTEEPQYQSCEDYDLWLRLARDGAVFHGMTERLVRYRDRANSISAQESRRLRRELAVLQKNCATGTRPSKQLRRRFWSLHQDLINALISEGKYPEARACLDSLKPYQSKFSRLAQKTAMTLMPRPFGMASRFLRRFYRDGQVLQRLSFRLRSAAGR